MFGIEDYGSSDDESPVIPSATTNKTTDKKLSTDNTQNNSKKRVITLPSLARNRDDEDDLDDYRPVKKQNTGSSLSSLLPAPKNTGTPSSTSTKKQETPTQPDQPATLNKTNSTKTSKIAPKPTKKKEPTDSHSSDGVEEDVPFFSFEPLPYAQKPAPIPQQTQQPTTYPPAASAQQPQTMPQQAAQEYYQDEQYQFSTNPQEYEYDTNPAAYQDEYHEEQQPVQPYIPKPRDFQEYGGANFVEVSQKEMLKNRPRYQLVKA